MDTNFNSTNAMFRTSLGVRVKDGVILAVEKLIASKMLEPSSNRHLFTVDNNAGLVRSPFHRVGVFSVVLFIPTLFVR